MPREWFDFHAAVKIDDPEKRALYLSILADKKPYFMQYIYSDLRREYKKFAKSTDRKCILQFGCKVCDLIQKPTDQLTEDEQSFLTYYNRLMPVSMGTSATNRICWAIERAFDSLPERAKICDDFDYAIMKTSTEYNRNQYYAVKKVIDEYSTKLVSSASRASREAIRSDRDVGSEYVLMGYEYRQACDAVCSNSDILCNIVLDLCYSKKSTKSIVWHAFMPDILTNLLRKNEYCIKYPVRSDDGDITYGGDTFKIVDAKVDADCLWRIG